jgi:hypothetical protein
MILQKHELRTPFTVACFIATSVFLSPATQASAATTSLGTSGNKIVQTNGQHWVGHGVNLPDPRCNNSCYDAFGNHANDPNLAISRLKSVVALGANFIRLPLESDRLQDGSYGNILGSDPNSNIFDDPNYLPGIKAIVDAAAALPGVYLMLSLWHDTSLTYNPINNTYSGTPSAASDAIYNKLVDTFHAYPSVMFGVTNEPFTTDDPNIWSAMNHAVQTIRTREAQYGSLQHLISVQGRQYTNDVSYYVANPITAGGGKNIIYEAHLYDQNSISSFNQAAASIPVVVGEYGPSDANYNLPNDWQGINYYSDPTNRLSLQQIQQAYASWRKLEISYLAWAYAQQDAPNMLGPDPHDGNYHLTCQASAGLPAPTTFGQTVYNDLAKPYRSRALTSAILSILE